MSAGPSNNSMQRPAVRAAADAAALAAKETMVRQFLLAACVLLCTDAHAMDFSNGCGSGWNQPVVPDSPMGYEFKDACDKHDNCYSRCMKGGTSFGTTEKCDQTSAVKETRRQICDEQFDQEIARICSTYPTEKICRLLGKIYFVAVRLGGSGSFDGYEVQALVERLRTVPEYDTSMLEMKLDTAIQKHEDLSNVRIRMSLNKDAASTTWSTQSQPAKQDIFLKDKKDKFGDNILDLNKEILQRQYR